VVIEAQVPSLLDAVHAQPGADVNATLPMPPLAATVALDGDNE
jgi:hypothetical protein